MTFLYALLLLVAMYALFWETNEHIDKAKKDILDAIKEKDL